VPNLAFGSLVTLLSIAQRKPELFGVCNSPPPLIHTFAVLTLRTFEAICMDNGQWLAQDGTELKSIQVFYRHFSGGKRVSITVLKLMEIYPMFTGSDGYPLGTGAFLNQLNSAVIAMYGLCFVTCSFFFFCIAKLSNSFSIKRGHYHPVYLARTKATFKKRCGLGSNDEILASLTVSWPKLKSSALRAQYYAWHKKAMEAVRTKYLQTTGAPLPAILSV